VSARSLWCALREGEWFDKVWAATFPAIFILYPLDFILKLHTPWFHAMMYTTGILGPAAFIVGRYRFLTREFLPVYTRLETLCERVGMRCTIRTTRMRWLVNCVMLCMAFAMLLGVAGPIFWNRNLWVDGVRALASVCLSAGAVLIQVRLYSTVKEADRLIQCLEEGRGFGELRSVPHAARFILLLIPRRHREHLIGDLEEEFSSVVLPEYGLRKARLWYWSQVLTSIWPLFWAEVRRIAGIIVLWKSVR
jgi:hypothetical protein